MSAIAVQDASDYLQGEIDDILSACTRCGKCVEVCPVVPHSVAALDEPAGVVSNLLGFMADQKALDSAASGWLHSCNGCGDCIPVCPDGINPRKMLLLGNIRESAGGGSRTPQLFRRMARAIKMMIAMQLVPAEYARLFVPAKPRRADLVFYLGCNALRTPNLLFNTMYVLDALEADYEVAGGPSSCCGVIATKWEGDVKVGGRVTVNTITRFEGFQPDRVLNWCPTCQIHLGETMGGFKPRSFDFDHVTGYLLERSEDLRALFVHPIRKRVVLHAHRGMPEIGQNVEALLKAIPGLEVVETVYESSYTCGGSGCSKSPTLQAEEHAHLLDRVKHHRADVLVTLYHGCHMAFMSHEKEGEFEVLNFTELLAQAAGQKPHEDRLKQMRLLDDWRSVVDEAQPYLRQNGLEIDSAWLEKHGPEIFSVAEFRGGLDCLASDAPRAVAAANSSTGSPPHPV